MLRSFSDWSEWFQRGLDLKHTQIKGSRTALLVVMGWIIANADSEGGALGIGRDDGGWDLWVREECSLSSKELSQALRDLVDQRLLKVKMKSDNKIAELQVVFHEPVDMVPDYAQG